MDSNLEEAGEVEERLAEKKVQYDKLVALHREKRSTQRRGQREETDEDDDSCDDSVLPIGEGSLIIDEVKVSACAQILCQWDTMHIGAWLVL